MKEEKDQANPEQEKQSNEAGATETKDSKDTTITNENDLTVPDRFKGIYEAAKKASNKADSSDKKDGEDKTDKQDEDKSETAKPDDEKKRTDAADDEEVEYAGDKITFKKGEAVTELTKLDLGEGKFAYVPESHKNGFMKDADYTQKTQALSKEKEAFLAEKQTVEAMNYARILGREIDAPNLDDYKVTPEILSRITEEQADKFLEKADYDEETAKKLAAEELLKAKYNKDLKEFNQFNADREKLKSTRAEVIEKNKKIFGEFAEKNGKEVTEKVIEKAKELINPFVFDELIPYPAEALEIIRKALNYDDDIKKAIAKGRLEMSEELGNKKVSEKNSRVISNNSKTPDKNNSFAKAPDRWGGVMQQLEKAKN